MSERIRDVNGREWMAGCLPRTTKVGDGTFKVYGTDGTPPILSREQRENLPDVINPSLVWHIIYQAQQNSCCGCMGVGLIMLLREILGLVRVILSQASLYGQGNGGRDQGMNIDTCLRLAMEVGACPVSLIDQYNWKGFHNRTWPAEWETVAKRYRILEAWDCTSIEHVISANKLGYPVGYGAKGHAVIRIGRNLDINSWGDDWGDHGLGQWVDERTLEREIQSYGAWALRLTSDPLDDGDLPQPKGN